ncbi:MAG: hypothetical protein OSB47_09415, partial [Pirellulaceae bacterium]|nr:hypothetical protein [Pirellulaceae bacterium]
MAITHQTRNQATDPVDPAPNRQHQRGAWGLSLAIHLGALVLIGLIWQSLPTPVPPETVRSG